jgi:hypothetical protein
VLRLGWALSCALLGAAVYYFVAAVRDNDPMFGGTIEGILAVFLLMLAGLVAAFTAVAGTRRKVRGANEKRAAEPS